MLSYFTASDSFSLDSRFLDSLRFRFKTRLKAAAEKADSFSIGLSFGSAFGVIEKLGALGPLGRVCGVVRWNSLPKLGRIYSANSPPLFGSDEEMNGEILRVLFEASSKENGCKLGLELLSGRWSSVPNRHA